VEKKLYSNETKALTFVILFVVGVFGKRVPSICYERKIIRTLEKMEFEFEQK
jgi:hypothetical protein